MQQRGRNLEVQIDFKVAEGHHYWPLRPRQVGAICQSLRDVAGRVAYLIYVHAENEHEHMRDLPTSTGRSSDSVLRRRGQSTQNYPGALTRRNCTSSTRRDRQAKRAFYFLETTYAACFCELANLFNID